ncbi:hypothetical protein M3936_14345 [Sutcliffiella horikoshii]|uniref:hypothetical protein n=1 Tax=Sutcliffiella horikoshii TaxID=79883 RepID=UPI0020406574|nr:hypothetical protein [Sutcliffiella horikoshii]MCM3618767.1 hypothetical protein [Sutcliffiella horikoshii]
MELVSLVTGILVTSFAVSIFSNKEDVQESMLIDEVESPGRLVTLSCQTCRKLKRHREIQEDLFECTGCGRQIDVR